MSGMVDQELTSLGRYLRDTGTRQAWLAEQLGVTAAKVCRWSTGFTGMRASDKRRVLDVLAARAAASLDGLLEDIDDIPELREPSSRPRPTSAGSPFERFLAEGS